MRRSLVATVLAGLATLIASGAQATDPPPTKAGDVADPQPGQVVATFRLLPDGSCDLGAAGLTLTGPVAVEFDEDCRAVTVTVEPTPGTAAEGTGVDATP